MSRIERVCKIYKFYNFVWWPCKIVDFTNLTFFTIFCQQALQILTYLWTRHGPTKTTKITVPITELCSRNFLFCFCFFFFTKFIFSHFPWLSMTTWSKSMTFQTREMNNKIPKLSRFSMICKNSVVMFNRKLFPYPHVTYYKSKACHKFLE